MLKEFVISTHDTFTLEAVATRIWAGDAGSVSAGTATVSAGAATAAAEQTLNDHDLYIFSFFLF